MTEEIARLEKQQAEIREKLAAARRRLPKTAVTDYRFQAANGETATLSELFGDSRDLLVIHNMGKSCPYCTLWADGFNGVARHLENRAGFVLVSPDDPKTQQEFAAQRGWTFRMVSGAGNTFAKDMGFESEDGHPQPGASAFRKNDDGSIVRTGTAGFGPGDDFCAVWHLLDLFADGANGWAPKYTY